VNLFCLAVSSYSKQIIIYSCRSLWRSTQHWMRAYINTNTFGKKVFVGFLGVF